jgi:hypothetical protein
MPTMQKSDFAAEVVWLGHVPAGQGLRAAPVETLQLTFDGAAGERHGGGLRPSCSRMTMLYPKGTEIRNVRQLSVLCADEMAEIASRIDLEALDPALLGVSVVLKGIPDFTHVPPSSRLQGPSGVTLTIDMENLPCIYPGKEIETESPGHGKAFKAAAHGRRGVTAWVERPGALTLGDRLELFVPTQRPWAP